MPGLLTNGLPQPSTSAGTFPFTGTELIPMDSELSSGQSPQSEAASTSQLLGVVPAAGPHNTAYASSITIDGVNGAIQTVGALTGSITIAFQNIVPGFRYKLKLVQDGTGTRAATLSGTWKLSGSQSTTASYVDWLDFWYDGTTYWGIWQDHFA